MKTYVSFDFTESFREINKITNDPEKKYFIFLNFPISGQL